jgi:hypothetical protein
MAVATDVGVGVGVGADEDAGDGASEEAASLACKLVYHQRECVDTKGYNYASSLEDRMGTRSGGNRRTAD